MPYAVRKCEYISREDVKEIAELATSWTDFGIRLDKLPAADVRPVKRGEWDKYEDFDEYGGGRYVEWSCSECFSIVKRGWAVRDKNCDKKPTENFCPNCGAEMRGADDAS